jgi:hypothetical protein
MNKLVTRMLTLAVALVLPTGLLAQAADSKPATAPAPAAVSAAPATAPASGAKPAAKKSSKKTSKKKSKKAAPKTDAAAPKAETAKQ